MDRGVEAIDGAAFAEDSDHFVDSGADGAAGDRNADWLRELAEQAKRDLEARGQATQ